MSLQDRISVVNYEVAALFGDSMVFGKNFAFGRPPTMEGQSPFMKALAEFGGVELQPRIYSLRDTDLVKILGGSVEIAPSIFKTQDFAAVWQDRDLYRPKGKAHVFVALPNRRNEEVTFTVTLDGQKQKSRKIRVLPSGMMHFVIKDLYTGTYTITLEGSESIKTSFQVAEFRPAPVEAIIRNRVFDPDADKVTATIYIESSGEAKADTPVRLELHVNGNRFGPAQKETTDENGQVTVTFMLGGAEENISITGQLLMETEKTFELFLRGAAKSERETTRISGLGQIWEVSLLPLEGAVEKLGMHFLPSGTAITPFARPSVIENEVHIIALHPMPQVIFEVVNAVTGVSTRVIKNKVGANDEIVLSFDGPLALVSIGAIVQEGTQIYPWEGYTWAVKDQDLELTVEAIASVQPGEELSIRLKTNRPGKSLPVALTMRDIRLTAANSGILGLARWIKEQMSGASGNLMVGTMSDPLSSYMLRDSGLELGRGRGRGSFSEVLVRTPPQFRQPENLSFDNPQPQRRSVATRSEPVSKAPIGERGGRSAYEAVVQESKVLVEQAVQTLVAFMTPRIEVGETIFADIVDVNGEVTIKVSAGSRIADYQVEAFVLDADSLQWYEATTIASVNKPVYGEITAPDLMMAGNEAASFIHVESESKRAQVTITHDRKPLIAYRGKRQIQPGEVVDTPVDLRVYTGPGEIVVDVVDVRSGKRDVSSAVIETLGKSVRRANRTFILQKGKKITLHELGAIDMFVSEGLDKALMILRRALVAYGRACCEQTSAIMWAALEMALQGALDAVASYILGDEREHLMYLPGRGFALYPEYNDPNDHYGKIAARNLFLMRMFEQAPDIDESLRAAIQDAVQMGRNALNAYRLPLIPTNPTNMREAFECALAGNMDNARRFVEPQLKQEGKNLIVPAGDIVSARMNTAYAMAVLIMDRQIARALPGVNWVLSQFNEKGMSYSTLDSTAALVMMNELGKIGLTAKAMENTIVKVNDVEMPLADAVRYSDTITEIEAVNGPIVLTYGVQIIEDWFGYASMVPFEVMFMKNGSHAGVLKPGDSIDLEIILTNGYDAGHLCQIALNPSLRWVRGGGQVSQFSGDFEGKNKISFPLVVTSSTKDASGAVKPQHMAVQVVNMFEQEKRGCSGPIVVTVQ